MADYSEFPTTPTAWQEQQWQMVAPLATEDHPQPPERRKPDLLALVPGLFFVLLAVSTMAGVDLTLGLLDDAGLLWLVLIGAGIALLVKELWKARGRR
ncbi:hypothetical protein [Blastococcus sp. SYSU DS1024]